jgi:DNA-binding response OmpR family regulator
MDPNQSRLSGGRASGPAVLVADDDPEVRSALRTRLTAWGYRVIECHDGLGTIVKTNGLRLDAIILDHEMPLGEGRSIAEWLRKQTDAPIIFLSGHSGDEFREILLRIPETYYLPKPLDSTRLWDLLESLQPVFA